MEIIIEEEINNIFDVIYQAGRVLEVLVTAPHLAVNIKKSIAIYKRAVDAAEIARMNIMVGQSDNAIDDLIIFDPCCQKNPFPYLTDALEKSLNSLRTSWISGFSEVSDRVSQNYGVDIPEVMDQLKYYIQRTKELLEPIGRYIEQDVECIEPMGINFQPLDASNHLAEERLEALLKGKK